MLDRRMRSREMGLLSYDSARFSMPGEGTRSRDLNRLSVGQNWLVIKISARTVACGDLSITLACYLCNTHPKTAGPARFCGVPLLRVQGCWVIVSVRRRGASRGRPVIGG